MALTAALVGGGLAAAGGIASSAIQAGASGPAQKQDLGLAQLRFAENNATNAQIQNAMINQLARAGYTDSSGNSLRFDPATGQWVQQLGALPQQEQDAASRAAIERNTTDLMQAQGANRRADVNAARFQPLIDAARRRIEGFQEMTPDTLSGLLGSAAADANTQAYRPIIQSTQLDALRSRRDPGNDLAAIGKQSAETLRSAMIDAKLKGITGAGEINNQRRQGLSSDLQMAMTGGTPQFQYPQIIPSTNNKDMLAAITSRANNAGITSAYGLNATAASNKAVGDASAAYGNTIPMTDPTAEAVSNISRQAGSLFKNEDVQKGLASLFAKKPFDPAGGLGGQMGTSFGDPSGKLYNSGGVF